MRWAKRGLVYRPDGSLSWATTGAMTPTPILLDPSTIRVYAGFRDDLGVSRIGYVDVDADDPSRILGVSSKPALDVGEPGSFDDNGVILGEVIRIGDELWMYYVGFQLVANVKFLAFTGLAISADGGETFARVSRAPILDRTDAALYFRALHCVLVEDATFKSWILVGDRWVTIDGAPFPTYDIQYLESANGITFPDVSTTAVPHVGDEHRLARPRVFKVDGMYRMIYCRATPSTPYVMGYAESLDGKDWVRRDDLAGIDPDPGGWESGGISFAALMHRSEKYYLFYNGRQMGTTGFGYAVLEEL